MATRSVVAVDIGAESGRVMLVHYDGRQLQCEEIRRFPNRPAKIAGHLFWDVLALWNEICLGLGAARQAAGHLDSIGIDTWGVDYALVLRYQTVFEECARLTNIGIHGIHILGGGARNGLINQWLADAMDVPVLAGPTEATALGNALMQLVALGELATLSDVRTLARQQPTQNYFPRAQEHARWQERLAHFQAL